MSTVMRFSNGGLIRNRMLLDAHGIGVSCSAGGVPIISWSTVEVKNAGVGVGTAVGVGVGGTVVAVGSAVAVGRGVAVASSPHATAAIRTSNRGINNRALGFAR
jgi:hypothetical protein